MTDKSDVVGQTKDPRDTPELTGSFTLVFAGDIRKFAGNPLKTETPFGAPVASGMGDAFAETDRLTAAIASERERAEVMSALAKKLGDTLMSFTPGGSEYFTKVAGDYYADAEACAVIIRDHMSRALKFAAERNAARSERDALARRVTELQGALCFYAEPARYTPEGVCMKDHGPYVGPEADRGEHARAVLKKENASG